MTEIQQRAIRSLCNVRVPEQGWHGTKIEKLNMWLTVQPEKPLPASDLADLWYLVWRYRRQIDDREVVAEADAVINGAFRLAFS